MLTPCITCGALSQGSYCPNHKPKPSPRTRPSSPSAQGYDRAWRRVRAEVLERDGYICRWCGKGPLVGADATVDHLLTIAQAPHLRLEPDNCVAACRKCNSVRANKGRSTRR